MPARRVVACVLCLLAGCSGPDYSAVRDWARTASIAADSPLPLQPDALAPRGTASVGHGGSGEEMHAEAGPLPGAQAGILAMQSALATYLSALATLASDGVLPYREDPFVALTPQAAAANADGGRAVGELGAFLRHASRTNMRAPEMREAIASADPAVQALVSGLSSAVTGSCVAGAGAAATALGLRERAQLNAAHLDELELPAARHRDPSACPAALDRYVEVLGGIAEGHAFLKANAARITQAEMQRQVRAAEDRLRRAMVRLPRRRRDQLRPARRTMSRRRIRRPRLR